MVQVVVMFSDSGITDIQHSHLLLVGKDTMKEILILILIDTSAFSGAEKITKTTTEEAANILVWMNPK